MTRITGNGIWMAALPILLCVTAQAGALARVTATLPEVPPPPLGQAQWVARSMSMNGLPMTLKAFQSRLTPDELLNHYESQALRWGRSEYRRSVDGDWQILGIKSAQHYISVQAHATTGGSEGTITVSMAPQRVTSVVGTQFPRSRTARLVSRQEYEDAGVESEHLSLLSPRAAIVEAREFAQQLTRSGWHVIRQQSAQRSARGVVIEAQRGAQQALLVLQPDSARPSMTAIVIVWRKS